MNKFFKIAVVAIVFVTGINANAQSKVAHLNVQQLLSDLPSVQQVQSEIKKLQATYAADIQNSFTELQKKAEIYKAEAPTVSAEENQKRGLELQNMEVNIQQAQNKAAQEIQTKQNELMAPIMKKAEEAINTIATNMGYDYVLDTSPGSVVIVYKGKDIMADVKKALNP